MFIGFFAAHKCNMTKDFRKDILYKIAQRLRLMAQQIPIDTIHAQCTDFIATSKTPEEIKSSLLRDISTPCQKPSGSLGTRNGKWCIM